MLSWVLVENREGIFMQQDGRVSVLVGTCAAAVVANKIIFSNKTLPTIFGLTLCLKNNLNLINFVCQFSNRSYMLPFSILYIIS